MAARAAVSAKKTATTKKTAKKTVRVPRKSTATGTAQIAGTGAGDELHAYIPDISVAKNYVGRQVWGIWDIKIADRAVANKQNILLSGDTGSGKTLFGEAYAAKNRMMYYSLPCDVSIDPSSIFGRMQPTDVPGKFKWQDGPATQVTRGSCGRGGYCDDPNCLGGVLNISEINFMTPKIAASLYPLLDGRRYIPLLGHDGEIVRAHHNMLIMADMNPNYRGTMELNAAFKNRFDFKIPWGYSDEVEKKLVKFPTMREIAGKVREMRDTEIRTPLSTNMLMEFEGFALDPELGVAFAINNFVSAFAVEEQKSIGDIFELHRTKLDKDIAFELRKKYIAFELRKKSRSSSLSSDEDLEEVDFEYAEED